MKAYTARDAIRLSLANPSFPTQGGHQLVRCLKWTSWLKGLHYVRALSGVIEELSARADARWWLGRQGEVQLFKQDFVISLRMRVAA